MPATPAPPTAGNLSYSDVLAALGVAQPQAAQQPGLSPALMASLLQGQNTSTPAMFGAPIAPPHQQAPGVGTPIFGPQLGAPMPQQAPTPNMAPQVAAPPPKATVPGGPANGWGLLGDRMLRSTPQQGALLPNTGGAGGSGNGGVLSDWLKTGGGIGSFGQTNGLGSGAATGGMGGAGAVSGAPHQSTADNPDFGPSVAPKESIPWDTYKFSSPSADVSAMVPSDVQKNFNYLQGKDPAVAYRYLVETTGNNGIQSLFKNAGLQDWYGTGNYVANAFNEPRDVTAGGGGPADTWAYLGLKPGDIPAYLSYQPGGKLTTPGGTTYQLPVYGDAEMRQADPQAYARAHPVSQSVASGNNLPGGGDWWAALQQMQNRG